MDTALDAELVDQALEAEAGGNDPNRADDGADIDDDLVGGAGDHVAARCSDILDSGDDALLLLLRQRADALVDQVRLDCSAARRIDDQRHHRRFHRERLAERAVEPARGQASPQRR